MVGLAVYTSAGAASYARWKLHGFEYPRGHRLIMQPEGGAPHPAPVTPPPRPVSGAAIFLHIGFTTPGRVVFARPDSAIRVTSYSAGGFRVTGSNLAFFYKFLQAPVPKTKC